MKDLKFLIESFVPLNPTESVQVVSLEEKDYWFEIILKNATETSGTLPALKRFFVQDELKIERIPGTQNVAIILPKIEIPTKYSIWEVIKDIERNKDNGIFLGVGEYGPGYFDFKKVTHMGFFGSTGFGKTQLARNLISQILAFQGDVVVSVIDPKRIGFNVFSNHPRFGILAQSEDEIRSLLNALHIEFSKRMEVFSQAFTTAPESLEEYNRLKKEYGRDDLPDFPRMVIFIDEFYSILNRNNEAGEALGFLLRKTRAFGIHFILSSQRASDGGSSIISQLSHIFSFYERTTSGLRWLYEQGNTDLTEKMKPIPGRLVVFDFEDNRVKTYQTPLFEGNDALLVSYGFTSQKVYPNKGFYRVSVRNCLFYDYCLAKQIQAGKDLEDCVESFHTRDNDSPYFSYPEIYDIVFKWEEKKKEELKERELADNELPYKFGKVTLRKSTGTDEIGEEVDVPDIEDLYEELKKKVRGEDDEK